MSRESPPSSSSSLPSFLSSSFHDSLESLTTSILKCSASATKASSLLPDRDSWHFYSTFSGFRKVMKLEREFVSREANRILEWNGIRERIRPEGNVEEIMERITEANDQLLERISGHLDEAEGLRKKKRKGEDEGLLVVASNSAAANRPVSGSWNRRRDLPSSVSSPSRSSSSPEVKLLTAKNISRPQLSFKSFVDNSLGTPFVPRLKEKPHSKKPLSILPEYDVEEKEFYGNPYLFELETLRRQDWQFQGEDPGEVVGIDKVPCVIVDDGRKLATMIEELSRERVIGVDTEHHWYRSYLGITSLIQISSESKDYIIDPYPIWADLPALNEIFADPRIVKVLHGADSDVIWLQRDFSVYLVNIFDTHLGAKSLGFGAGTRNYASVLNHYCRVKADKRFQLADWRIRPLPEEMIKYARMDTRHLILIYKAMKSELVAAGNENNNLLRSTLDASNELCKQFFRKPILTPSSHQQLLRRSRTNFNSRQAFALAELFQWRDKIAREEDESPAYVLPDHMLLKICSELPREMQGILACCSPIPPLVKQNLNHIHTVILKAREQELTSVPQATEQQQQGTGSGTIGVFGTDDILENPLRSPLDLGPIAEGGSTLFDDDRFLGKKIKRSKIYTKEKADIELFNSPATFVAPKMSLKQFLSPYQRYLMLKPYLELINSKGSADEAKEAENKTDEDRVKSIRAHFESLTAMTSEEYSAEGPTNEQKDAVEDEEEESEDGEEEPEEIALEHLDPGEVKPLRSEKSSKWATKRNKRKQAKRAEGCEDESQVAKQPRTDMVDYDKADFGQFSKSKNGAGASGQFNPWEGFGKKKKGGGGKQKQKMRSGAGKSMSYKK